MSVGLLMFFFIVFSNVSKIYSKTINPSSFLMGTFEAFIIDHLSYNMFIMLMFCLTIWDSPVPNHHVQPCFPEQTRSVPAIWPARRPKESPFEVDGFIKTSMKKQLTGYNQLTDPSLFFGGFA